jgi:hypothetical protein
MLVDTVAVWAQAVLGNTVEVVIEPANAGNPSGPYVTIRELLSQSDNYPIQEVTEGETNETAVVTSELFKSCVLEFNAYATNGEALLDDLVCASYEPDGLCIQDFGDVRPLTFLEDSGYSPRYQREITFGATHVHTVTVQTALTEHFTGDFAGVDFEIGAEPAPPVPDPED